MKNFEKIFKTGKEFKLESEEKFMDIFQQTDIVQDKNEIQDEIIEDGNENKEKAVASVFVLWAKDVLTLHIPKGRGFLLPAEVIGWPVHFC